MIQKENETSIPIEVSKNEELILLRQLPIEKRVSLLEEKIFDLENLIEKYNELVKCSSKWFEVDP